MKTKNEVAPTKSIRINTEIFNKIRKKVRYDQYKGKTTSIREWIDDACQEKLSKDDLFNVANC